MSDCRNCQRSRVGPCVAHTVITRVCGDCGVEFQGTARHQRCPECAVARGKKYYNGGTRKNLPKISKICIDCSGQYVGYASSARCNPCKLQRKRLGALGWTRGFRAIEPTKPKGPATPPVCTRCCYFKPEPTYPSGMQCLAEAFLRCQPWAPGARPLKEEDDAD